MSDFQAIEFKPDAWYSEYTLRLRRNWTEEMLARARKAEGLRCKQVGRERLYKGEWLNDWLSTPTAS